MMTFLASTIGPQAAVRSPAAGSENAVKASTAELKKDADPAPPKPAPQQLDPARGILWDDQRPLDRVSHRA